MTIDEIIKTRRSVFADQFEPGKKVPDEIIQKMIENATYAPNHGKSQPWFFTVFTGEGLQKLANFQSELYKSEAGENFKEITYKKMQHNPLKASQVIAIGLKRSVNEKIPLNEDIAAVACAVQNMALTAHAYGVGGFWSTGGITYFPSAKSFFQLSEDDLLMGFFYVGYIKHPSTLAPRKLMEETTTWISE